MKNGTLCRRLLGLTWLPCCLVDVVVSVVVSVDCDGKDRLCNFLLATLHGVNVNLSAHADADAVAYIVFLYNA